MKLWGESCTKFGWNESCRQLLAGRVSQHPLITHASHSSHTPHQTYRSTRHLPHRPPIDYADDWRGITSTYSPVPLCNQLTDSFVAMSSSVGDIPHNETDWRMRLELHFFEGTRTLTISWMQRSWSESKCTSPFCVVKGCLLLPNTLNECLYVKLRSYYK